jgi:8-amino-7-oxononanoate synthase
MSWLSEGLERLESKGLLRQRRLLGSAQGALIEIDGKGLLSFASNDYLGLAHHSKLREAAIEGIDLWGVGAGSSHLICGHHRAHQAFEDAAAKFVGLPRALVFSTGYMANIGVVTALVGRGDAVFADRLNHASLNDAALLSRADFERYPHRNLDVLQRLLSGSNARRKLVASDSVFSMDGDIADVPALVELCEHHGALLLIDDAHGFGVLGAAGRGALSHFGVASERVIYLATLGKAAGVFGAFVAAQNDVIERLVQRARTYIYTTAAPPLLSHALLQSLDVIRSEEWRRVRLTGLIRQLRATLRLRKWRLLPSQTPVQPVVIGESSEASHASDSLLAAGILVPAIRPPTVPTGQARLRISISAAHSDEHIDRLVAALHSLA